MSTSAIDERTASPRSEIDARLSPARPLPLRPASRHSDRLLDAGCRALDILGSAVLLVVLAPLLGLIALAIRLDSRGPALFRQQRIGRNRRPFTVNKFRTMYDGVAHDQHREFVTELISGQVPEPQPEQESIGGQTPQLQAPGPRYKMTKDPRITRCGRMLRRSSLDELPQLWNVLCGEMSLVGPRPPIPYEVEQYPPHWFARFAVKPGVTGLWQVGGRSDVTLEEMVRLDVEYIQHRSLWLNIAIILRTVPAVLSAKGAW